MKIILALIEALIIIFGMFITTNIIGNAIDYINKEVKDKHINTLVLLIFIEGILVGIKYYLEVANL